MQTFPICAVASFVSGSRVTPALALYEQSRRTLGYFGGDKRKIYYILYIYIHPERGVYILYIYTEKLSPSKTHR